MNYYKNRLCLNCLAKDVQNARDIYEAMDGNALIGVLSADYNTVDEAVADMSEYQKAIDNQISVGLGAGNPKQGEMVALIAKALQPAHVNQIFPLVGKTRGMVGNDQVFINSLVSPTGRPGYVKINTGPESAQLADAAIPVETAVALVREMGGNSLKFFPMGGLKSKDELTEVAKACGKSGFTLEPTGGIDLENLPEIIEIALSAGVEKLIVHVYSSIICKETGLTKIDDVKRIYDIFKQIAG